MAKAPARLLIAIVLALLTGASAGTLPDRPKAVRDASKSSRASTMAKSAALAQSHSRTRRGLFEPPKGAEPRRRSDVSDSSSADLVGAVAAGACACM